MPVFNAADGAGKTAAYIDQPECTGLYFFCTFFACFFTSHIPIPAGFFALFSKSFCTGYQIIFFFHLRQFIAYQTFCAVLGRRNTFSSYHGRVFEPWIFFKVLVGPGNVLSALIAQILGPRPHRAIALSRKGRSDLTCLNEGLGQLSVSGVPLAYDRLWADFAPELETGAGSSKPSWKIRGSSYGKPYPPAGGAPALPAPNLEAVEHVPAARVPAARAPEERSRL